MQQSGVTNLLHLLGRKANRRVGPGIDAIHDFREADRHLRNAQRMAGGRGIALLDGRDRSLHEAFEQLFDVLIEAAIFVGDGGLRGERKRQPHGSIGKRLHFARDHFRARQARLGMQPCN